MDTKGTAWIDTISQAPFKQFSHPDFGRQQGAVWAHLRIEHRDSPIDCLLRVGPPLLAQVDLWASYNGVVSHYEGGLQAPMSRRAYPDRETLFPVTLSTGYNDFYLRIASPSLLRPSIHIWHISDWQKHARLADLGNALLSGALLMIVVITISFACWTQEWYWLCYAAGICSYTVFEACDDGFAAFWLWPERPLLTLTVLPAALALDISMYVIFFLLFIPLKTLHPGWRLLWSLPIAASLGLCLTYWGNYRVGMPIINSVVLVAAVSLPVLSLMAWRKGFAAGRWAPLGFGIVFSAICHRLGVGWDWWPDIVYADIWLLPLSGVIGSGLLLLAQLERLREFRIAEQRYLSEIATARDRAFMANRAKSFLLARVSHDLRTPMHNILGYLDQIHNEQTTRTQTRYLREIRISNGNMLGLVDELLQYTRGEDGKLELNPKLTYLHGFLREITSQAEVLAGQHNNRLIVDLDLPIALAVIDGDRLRSVVMNLLINACRVTVQGTIYLSVCGTVEGVNVRLKIEVRDTGPGIAPEDRERIFLPFTHGGSDPGSMGLGLAIVRQLVTLMKGDIQLESIPGHGAAFLITLLAQIAEETGEAFLPATYSAPKGYEGPIRTLLIVDSIDSIIDHMQDLLYGMGFDVMGARGADEALALAQGAKLDAAIIEQNLDEGNGWQLLDGLKDLNPDMPVILLSATPADPTGGRKSGRGFDAELLKPLRIDTFTAVLAQCMALKWRRETVAPSAPAIKAIHESLPVQAIDLKTLRDAANEGNLFEVEEWIHRWRQQPKEHDFLQTLEPLAATAKWSAIVTLVDRRIILLEKNNDPQ